MLVLGDGEVLRRFNERSCIWQNTLAEIALFHREHLGRKTGPIEWSRNANVIGYQWLGFFWESPAFWFGYGLRGGMWLPFIESDSRVCQNETAFASLQAQLPEHWGSIEVASRYTLRMWAPEHLENDYRAQVKWIQHRSRELNEFSA